MGWLNRSDSQHFLMMAMQTDMQQVMGEKVVGAVVVAVVGVAGFVVEVGFVGIVGFVGVVAPAVGVVVVD